MTQDSIGAVQRVTITDSLLDEKTTKIHHRNSCHVSYVCVYQSVVQREIWTPPCSSLQLCPLLPGGNGCSGNLVQYGFCSALHKLLQTEGKCSVQKPRLHSGGNNYLTPRFIFLMCHLLTVKINLPLK